MPKATTIANKPYGEVNIIEKDLRTGKEKLIYVTNRIVLRSHVVFTHLLAQTPNFVETYGGDEALQAQLGSPTPEELRITKIRFGRDSTSASVEQDALFDQVSPGFDADGLSIEDDFYSIDTYRYTNGPPVGEIPDYDAKITFETLMAGPQGNSGTAEFIEYREAGLFTENDIMFARTTFPPLAKDENFSFKFSWTISLP